MSLPRLAVAEMPTDLLRDNFQKLMDFFRQESPFLGFKGFEVTFTTTESHYKFKHSLGFVPKDVFITHQDGSGVVTVNYPLANADSIDFTITGTVTPQAPHKIRFFAGTYNKEVR